MLQGIINLSPHSDGV